MFNLPKIEEEILKFWQEKGVFNKLREKNQDGKPWSFLDGPITANNPMGVHHGWGRTLKDLFQRFHAMKGEKLRYQNGFDCQGLWVEVEVEKELGFKTKKDIEEYGIDKFVNKCKERVEKYSKIQTEQSKRLGYWMDWGNSYYTMSDENNYMIWHFLKKVWGKGELYKGRDSVPWCPRCGTAISQHEILGEEYKEITHKSVYFKLPIVGRVDEYFLVWTTTPWTILANAALAVGDDIDYVKVRAGIKKSAKNSGFQKGDNSPGQGIQDCHLYDNSIIEHGKTTVKSNQKQAGASGGKESRTPGVQVAIPTPSPERHHMDTQPAPELYQGSYIVAKDLVERVFRGNYEVVEEFKGKDLAKLKLKYQGLFDSLPRVQEAHKENPETFHTVISDQELVTTEEGTGIVHIAPGAGAEDFKLSKEKNLPVIGVIDEAAVYLEGLEEFSGQNAKRNPEIIFDYLRNKEGGRYLFKTEDYTHRYPTCWRCKEELVWRVVDEWYIAMDKLRHNMMAVTRKINWLPSFGLDRELDWLKNMRDWLISKKRYWGLALPIWECTCGHFEVIGSKEELQERAVEGWDEFEGHTPHKPWVDKVKIKCPKCDEIISRIPDVGNPWLDAGIVPFSTLVDPETKKVSYTDDKKYWSKWFPADFITECFPGQFKNWFYSLIAMSTVLENTNPFKILLGHALVKDEQGEEMHKSKGNAIWFDDAVERMGADVIRWMYVSNNPAIDVRFGYHIGEEVKRGIFIPLLNVVNFYKMFSERIEVSNLEAKDLSNVLDIWITVKLNVLVKDVTKRLENFNPAGSSKAIAEFITELSTWYVRRSRGRFKSEDLNIKLPALSTLRRVLFNLARLLAPFTPFTAEYVYQELEGVGESVHLRPWPAPEFEKVIGKDVLNKMALVRQIVELGLAKRMEARVAVRQPLKQLTIDNLPLTLEQDYLDLVKDEVNIKKISLGQMSSVTGQLSATLDTKITQELRLEGLKRELVRQINGLRKKAGLTIKDTVKLVIETDSSDIKKAIETYSEDILKGTLASDFIDSADTEAQEVKIGGEVVIIKLGLSNS